MSICRHNYTVSTYDSLQKHVAHIYLLKSVQKTGALIVKVLRVGQRCARERKLGGPDSLISKRGINLPNVARKALEIAIPMHRYEINRATAFAVGKEGSQPIS